MKKITLCMVLIFMVAFSMGVGANPLAKNGAEVGATSGAIVSVDGDRILVKGRGNYDEIELRIGVDTHIVDGVSGEHVAASQLKEGDQVTVYYGGAVTRSLPPQGNAVAVIVGGTDDRAIYMRVGRVVHVETDMIRVLNTNGDSLVTIKADQVQDVHAIGEGSEVLVWYKMMTLSMPGQATSTKTVVLSKPADIKAHLTSGVVVAGGEELAENLVIVDDTVYLPLRSLCEKMGYTVQWNEKDKSIMVAKGAKTANLAIGSQEYAKMKMRVRLDKEPQMIDGKTFVPSAFFTEVMDLQVEILKSHV